MQSEYSVSLKKLIEDMKLDVVYTPSNTDGIYITSKEVNRPGLIFIGYDEYFDNTRVNFFGLNEVEYLNSLSSDGSSRFKMGTKTFFS